MVQKMDANQPVFNVVTAMEAVDGDRATLREIVEAFCVETPELINGIKLALDSGDVETLCRGAHMIKGSARMLGGMQLGSTASTLQEKAESGCFDEVPALVAALEHQYSAFEQCLLEMTA